MQPVKIQVSLLPDNKELEASQASDIPDENRELGIGIGRRGDPDTAEASARASADVCFDRPRYPYFMNRQFSFVLGLAERVSD